MKVWNEDPELGSRRNKPTLGDECPHWPEDRPASGGLGTVGCSGLLVPKKFADWKDEA